MTERPRRAIHPRETLKYDKLGGTNMCHVHWEDEENGGGGEGEMEKVFCFGVNLPHEPTTMEEALAGPN